MIEIGPDKQLSILTGVIILVLLNTLVVWFAAGLTWLGVPRWVNSICSVALLISQMTWVIMPRVTRVLQKWLTT